MNRKRMLNLKETSPRQFKSQIKHLVNGCSKCHSQQCLLLKALADPTSNNANSKNLYFSQNTFTRNTPLAPNNIQYSQGAHQFQSFYSIFTNSNFNLDYNVEMPVSKKKPTPI